MNEYARVVSERRGKDVNDFRVLAPFDLLENKGVTLRLHGWEQHVG